MTARHEAEKQRLHQDEIENRKCRLLKVKAQLEAASYRQDQETAKARNVTNAGDWLSQSPLFKDWVDKSASQHSVLYVHGIPGAGKEFAVLLYLDNNLQSWMLKFSQARQL